MLRVLLVLKVHRVLLVLDLLVLKVLKVHRVLLVVAVAVEELVSP